MVAGVGGGSYSCDYLILVDELSIFTEDMKIVSVSGSFGGLVGSRLVVTIEIMQNGSWEDPHDLVKLQVDGVKDHRSNNNSSHGSHSSYELLMQRMCMRRRYDLLGTS